MSLARMLFLLAASPLLAQTGNAPPPAATPSLWARDHLLDLQGLRQTSADAGVDVDLYYNAFFGWNAKGGRNTDNAHRYSHSFDLFVRADTDRMGLWPGGSALLQVKNNYGDNVNPDVGGLAQVADDADFDEPVYVDQLYYEHDAPRYRSRFRLGYLDYQTIIDRNPYANSEDTQFTNAALDNNLLVPLKIGFGATLFWEPADWLGVIVGTADAENEIRSAGWDTAFGDGDGLMAYGEATVKAGFTSDRGELPGNYRFGVYYDPRSRPVFGEMRNTTGTLGTWLGFDQMIYREQDADRQGLGLFYRYGWREERSYAISRFHSAGLEYRGLLPGRDADACGVAFYDLVASDDFRAQGNLGFGGETGFEAYYRAQVSPWFAVTPDVQYITNPGGLDANPDALAFVLRARIKL